MYIKDILKFSWVTSVSRDPGALCAYDITEHAADARDGSIYCAKPGYSEEGAYGIEYISDAIFFGAQAIMIDHNDRDKVKLDEYTLSKIIVIEVDNIAKAYADIVGLFHPERPTNIIGVTGTNGKTSTAHFVAEILRLLGIKSASIGTLGIKLDGQMATNAMHSFSTLQVKSFYRALSQMKKSHQVDHLVTEVSSHGLDQYRVGGVKFNAAAFTSFSEDHMEYHKDMEDYFCTKLKLFTEHLADNGTAIINLNMLNADRVIDTVKQTDVRLIRYGCNQTDAEINISKIEHLHNGMKIGFSFDEHNYECDTVLRGHFQAENLICAIALIHSLGVNIQDIVNIVPDINAVPGRMEFAGTTLNGASVYIDYAHTEDGIRTVLNDVRKTLSKENKIYIVFGCGGMSSLRGGHDSKRMKMGKAASKYADFVYITDDNPRTEDPVAIRNMILMGCDENACDAGDRVSAIGKAIHEADKGDVVVIAGKGSEEFMEIALPEDQRRKGIETQKIPYSDLDTVKELLKKKITA